MRRDLLICLFLTVATLTVYWQVGDFEFINFDDPVYVYENRHIQSGITLKSIAWAFSSSYASNWHPLTWLSHMLDFQLFGLNSGAHHLINILFHLANTLLLFFALRKMTGTSLQSGFVAALFALHPLHVESTAWISERKDLLCTFFWMMVMWSYARYVKRPGTSNYFIVLLSFVLGLLAKPMIVTLPFVLLLLDFWPLQRFQFMQTNTQKSKKKKKADSYLVLEKMPLFLLSGASCIITFIVQKNTGAVNPPGNLPTASRLANTLVSYAAYIYKMIWPVDLAVYYPHQRVQPEWYVAGACLLIAAVSILAIRYYRRYPYLLIGWLWYIGSCNRSCAGRITVHG